MPRYMGAIGDLKGANKLSGFIPLSSVTHVDGRPATLPTTKNIFIHDDDMNEATITAGEKVVFQVETDSKRAGGLRARKAVPVSKATIEGGVEIHFDEQLIDHPLVPIRWCIKPETFKRIEAAPERQWALMLIAKTRPDADGNYTQPSRYSFMPIIGVRNIGFNRAYFSFPAPGEYDFAAFLISSNLAPDRLKQLHTEIERFYKRSRVWNTFSDEINLEVREYADDPMVIEATTRELVSVPEGIFAKPLPKWQRTWLSYFGLDRPEDECSTRGRSILAFTLGIAWFLLWESFKRSYMLALGLIHFILGGSPLPIWKIAFTPRLSALISSPKGSDEFERLTSFRGWRKLRHPALWLAMGGLAGVYVAFPNARDSFHQVLVIVTLFAGIIFLALLVLSRKFKRREETQEEREKEQANKVAEEATRQLTAIRTYAMCGLSEPQQAPTSIKLLWTGIKRKVCRTYA